MSSVIQHKPTNPDSDEIDLGRLIGEIVDHKKLVIAITGLFSFFAIIYVLFSTPIYQADALIQVEQKKGNELLSSISQMLPNSEPQSAPEVTLLQSRMILGKTVDDLALQAQIKENYFPIFGRGWSRITGQQKNGIVVERFYLREVNGKYPQLKLVILNKNSFKLIGNGLNLKGNIGELLTAPGLSVLVKSINAKIGTEFNINYISRLEAINNLQKSFTAIEQEKGSGMLNLTFTDSDPQLAKEILESISDNYLSQNISREAAQDTKSLDFLNEQLPKVRDQLNEAEDKLSSYRRRSDSVDLNLQARSALDQIVNVDNQLNQLTFREAEVSQLFTKDHPTYKALIEKRNILEKEKAKLNSQVSSMPATQQQVLSLSRDVESNRAVYMQLLNRQQELNIAKNSAIGNVRIIDDAVTGAEPVKPKKSLVILIGIILGVFFSFGLVLIRVFLRRGIESPEQLEEQGINVYASVPISEWMQKQLPKKLGNRSPKRRENTTFLAVDNPADLAIEAIRSLRTSLHFAMMEASNNILMISGASPNAGKTFITTNLAAVLAQGEQKVLFIDADMRKGYSHQIFNRALDNGLSDILSGKSTIEQGIKPVNGANFDFIARGKTPPNPSELLMHSRFQQLLNWASENYDIVLVDTPPILAVTDAAVIGRYVGTTLLVARFEENTAKEMEVSIKRFDQSGIEVKGCILNGVVKKASSYYGYGYSHYGYSYDDKK